MYGTNVISCIWIALYKSIDLANRAGKVTFNEIEMVTPGPVLKQQFGIGRCVGHVNVPNQS